MRHHQIIACGEQIDSRVEITDLHITEVELRKRSGSEFLFRDPQTQFRGRQLLLTQTDQLPAKQESVILLVDIITDRKLHIFERQFLDFMADLRHPHGTPPLTAVEDIE